MQEHNLCIIYCVCFQVHGAEDLMECAGNWPADPELTAPLPAVWLADRCRRPRGGALCLLGDAHQGAASPLYAGGSLLNDALTVVRGAAVANLCSYSHTSPPHRRQDVSEHSNTSIQHFLKMWSSASETLTFIFFCSTLPRLDGCRKPQSLCADSYWCCVSDQSAHALLKVLSC